HTTTGCGKQGFPSAQPYLSHTPGANPFCCMFLLSIFVSYSAQLLDSFAKRCLDNSNICTGKRQKEMCFATLPGLVVQDIIDSVCQNLIAEDVVWWLVEPTDLPLITCLESV
ncbi:hypothetical protein BO95DRAFT_354057, partial [Aspergillus brunneoviolaceus CBS 621.78]